MRRLYVMFVMGLFVICSMIRSSHAWGPDKDGRTTHSYITSYAVGQSVLDASKGDYLKILGLSSGIDTPLMWDVNNDGHIQVGDEKLTILQWLSTVGSALEDGNLRELNHFHNPLKDWSSAGWGLWRSALVWSQDSAAQGGWLAPPLPQPEINCEIVACFPDTSAQSDWSWQTTRAYFYSALTSAMDTNRQANFAKMFRGLGQQIHLLQDMSVPYHVRSDAHMLYRGIEEWAVKNIHGDADLMKLAPSPFMPSVSFTSTPNGYAPVVNLFDRNSYNLPNPDPSVTTGGDIGLAEYTNANFVSDDTIYSVGSFPYPIISNDALSSSVTKSIRSIPDPLHPNDPEAKVPRVYYEKVNHGDSGYLLSGVDTLTYYLNENGNAASAPDIVIPPLDNNVHEDYAKKLLPRAVGYSAGLLDYFFRGTLEISFPTAAVYSIADGSKKPYTANGNQHQTFTKIKASVMNTTPNNEAIRAGELRAVARYKIIPNYAADLSNYPPDGLVMAGNGTTTYPGVPYSYSVSEATEVVDGDIIPGYYTDFDFDFSNAPIPAGITDLTLQVVFKGTIGNEIDNAIAVGMMDLMEPTHITFWNLTDGFSIPYPGAENKLYTFGQLQGLAAQNSTILSWLDKTPAGSPNGSLNDEYILQALSSSFMISFWDGYGWIPAMDGNGVDISPSGYIRMIVLVDDPANNYAKLAWNNPYYTDEFYYSFPGVVNQVSQNGSYPIPTNIYPFRKASGTLAPIIQHWFMGNGYCATGPTHEVGLCSPDPYYNADPAVFPVSAAPIPFTSQFNQ